MTDDDLSPLRTAIRDWTGRPPRLTPGEARAQIIARLDSPKPWSLRRLAVAAVAIILLLIAVPSLFESEIPIALDPAQTKSAFVVLELRSGSKLYIPITSPSAGAAAANTDTKRGGRR